jgi:hypothetical protein
MTPIDPKQPGWGYEARVIEQLAAVEEERDELRDKLRGAVEALAALYRIDAATVARVCDEQADTTGRLLGVVRAAARGQ